MPSTKREPSTGVERITSDETQTAIESGAMPIAGVAVCTRCAKELQEGWRLCPACGTPVEGATRTAFADSSPSSSGVDEGRFPAGTVLAGRYKILGLIGHGGMGEVYRAFDQILNQAVALKFITGGELDDAALNRFRNEVRVARQVSHPNVCRVYDIGFVEGMHFLSMEYLDGENLGSLLRRIGRLPQDKAVEFARKICAGLAAAHERGVLHRDLKPTNIMIDGRGQVRITDFGLAAFAREIPLSDLRSGTPAYMAPEQKAGKEVTTRSDIYSLGLVLYEMFTGKHRGEARSNPSDEVKDLDHGIDEIIRRCLDEDPRRRPATPLAVAMGLPGGDPMAAALAAGETPSPEMVAASDVKEGFQPRTAVLCVAFVLLSTVIAAPLAQRTQLLNKLPIPISSDGLAFRAEDVLKSLGYAELPPFTAYGFSCCNEAAKTVAERQGPVKRDAILASHRPAVLTFWYRRSPNAMLASVSPLPPFSPGVVTASDPPNVEPGALLLQLDALGRLLVLHVRPQTRTLTAAPGTVDWNKLFEAAGLDQTRFMPARSERVPPMAIDAQQAWTGTYSDDRTDVVRIEAASFQGRPVFFEVAGATGPAPTGPRAIDVLVTAVFLLVQIGLFPAAALTAWHNVRLGRSDRRGAVGLTAWVFTALMLTWLLSANHVAGAEEVGLFLAAIVQATFWAGVIWLFYVAIEPYVRRNWPESLISWTRLHNGQFRDPLVTSHILAGLAGGSLIERIVLPGANATLSSNLDSGFGFVGAMLASTPANLAPAIQSVFITSLLALVLLILVVLVQLVTGRLWVADLLGALVIGMLGIGLSVGPVVGSALLFLVSLAWLWMLRRFGLLSVVIAFSLGATRTMPFVLTGWLATRSITLQAIPIVVAALALSAVLAAQPRRAIHA